MTKDVRRWLETTEAIQADTEGAVWRAAYESYIGKSFGGYDVAFLFEVEKCGYSVVPSPTGGYRLARVR